MNQHKTAFLFPGQGSQTVGMGSELAKIFLTAKNTFQRGDEILGFNLSHLAWEGPEEDLNDTLNTQPALFMHSIAAWRVFREMFPEIQPAYVAGHSMGELSALVAAGCMPFDDALQLTRRRGELMKQAGDVSPGGMAAILGLDIPTLDEICLQASEGGQIVQVANDNCPGQVVISGDNAALDRAMEMAANAKARKVVKLAVSIAAHSPLMTHAQNDFSHAVNNSPFSDPQIPIIGNVTAQPLSTSDQIKTDLQAQLNSRVRWTETIQFMLDNAVETFIEFGGKSVLCGLVKRINRKTNRFSFADPQDFQKFQNSQNHP